MSGWDDKGTWTVSWVDLEQGVWMYVCRSPKHNCPLGFLYGMALGKTFFIMGIYTPHWARRKGVATLLCDHLSLIFSTLMTQEGSQDGGKAFLEKYGFRHDDKMDWIYQKQGKEK
jgi:hypothetical protein